MKHVNILDNIKNIHFIGIGGSGMCPMAEILINKGFNITGSDTYKSDTLERIISYKIPVYMEHKKENIKNCDLVVYSAAIKEDNPELVEARRKGIKTIERSVMLGLISQKYENSIAVSGTHGKTTTTSMLTQIMIIGNFDPTSVIGGKLPSLGANSRIGNSDIMICEACEYVDSFLQLFPAVSIILNIDADHLDYFKNLENIKKSFNKFAYQTKKAIIVNGDDKNTLDALKDITIPIIKFGLNKNNDYYATDISEDEHNFPSFTLIHNDKKLFKVSLNVPGRHNVYNAVAAAACAHFMGVAENEIMHGLQQFKGVHRRFEILEKINDITIADDFAHHPTELKTTLNSSMKMGFNKVWAVFQPHTYSRTAMLLDDFAEVLSIPDKVILSEILAVRETNIYNIHTKDLADKIKGSVWFNTFEEITDYVVSKAQPGDLILTLGGGNVYVCANMILNKLKEIYK